MLNYNLLNFKPNIYISYAGGVPEWFKGAVLKTVVGASLPEVRILSPPI